MSRSSYTASERRGVLAIALVALLIIGLGAGISFFNNSAEAENEPLIVKEQPQMVDSMAMKDKKQKKDSKSKSKKKSKSSPKTKTKKTYRQRSPLDEPV